MFFDNQSRTIWKVGPQRVIAPYTGRDEVDRILSSAEHVKFCVNLPEPSGKAKYVERPIVNKYREGKVKSTLKKGVK